MFENSSWYSLLPPETLDCYVPNLRLFFETMYERQAIWRRRFIDRRERPWTENGIFQNYKFTNVYRELDRNSQWQIREILLDGRLGLKNLVWKLMIFRMFNCPETFEEGKKRWPNGIPDYDRYEEGEFASFIEGIRKSGRNPYTTAYLINSQATPGRGRDYCYTHLAVPTLHHRLGELIRRVLTAERAEDIVTYLKTLPTVADFIAHEYYQDFTYIPIYTGRRFMSFTQNDFTNVGPGAAIGIRLIYPSLKATEQKRAIYWLRDLAESELRKVGERMGEPMSYVEWNRAEGKYRITEHCNITLHQVEMWLCEFQKYWKMTVGLGKQRSKFTPRTKDIVSQTK